MVLYCFPYAGGSAQVFRQWQRYLTPNVTIVPLEPSWPSAAQAYDSVTPFEALVQNLQVKLEACVVGSRYAFWGHSMGAILAYEVAVRMQGAGLGGPIHLFVSGMPAALKPDRVRRWGDMTTLDGGVYGAYRPRFHSLPDRLCKRLERIGGGFRFISAHCARGIVCISVNLNQFRRLALEVALLLCGPNCSLSGRRAAGYMIVMPHGTS